VEDTGIGISQDKFELLFRAFSQIDNSNKRNYGGTGLGLAICEKLVQLMDGKIWVESQEGVGTKFHFTMILNSAEEKAPDSPVPNLVREVSLEDRECLVIEHSAIVRELLCRDIGAVGLQGNAVSNFAQARDCLKINRYSIIIVDWSLPKSDAFVREIADTNPYARVIVASNLGYAADTEGDNIVATLIKPIRRWRLIKALQQALNRTPSVPMNEIDYFTPRNDQRQALSTLAFRHPLRILVLSETRDLLIVACGG
jgi:AmiR/NasT family two-component response regulator